MCFAHTALVCSIWIPVSTFDEARIWDIHSLQISYFWSKLVICDNWNGGKRFTSYNRESFQEPPAFTCNFATDLPHKVEKVNWATVTKDFKATCSICISLSVKGHWAFNITSTISKSPSVLISSFNTWCGHASILWLVCFVSLITARSYQGGRDLPSTDKHRTAPAVLNMWRGKNLKKTQNHNTETAVFLHVPVTLTVKFPRTSLECLGLQLYSPESSYDTLIIFNNFCPIWVLFVGAIPIPSLNQKTDTEEPWVLQESSMVSPLPNTNSSRKAVSLLKYSAKGERKGNE